MATIDIPCPRCAGKGIGNWRPHAGVCYRCRGTKIVSIDTGKYLAVLRKLRAEYASLTREARAVEAAGRNAEEIRYDLAQCVASGLLVRATLVAAGVSVRR